MSAVKEVTDVYCVDSAVAAVCGLARPRVPHQSSWHEAWPWTLKPAGWRPRVIVRTVFAGSSGRTPAGLPSPTFQAVKPSIAGHVCTNSSGTVPVKIVYGYYGVSLQRYRSHQRFSQMAFCAYSSAYSLLYRKITHLTPACVHSWVASGF